MAYTIEIEYTTGDSYNTNRETSEVGCVWGDKEQARLALSYIKEHYELYNQLHGWNAQLTEKEADAIARSKAWVVEEDNWQYGLMLPCNVGSQRVSAFWCGYFERLISATIVSVEDDEDSYTPK